jgi:hypothetical protein
MLDYNTGIFLIYSFIKSNMLNFLYNIVRNVIVGVHMANTVNSMNSIVIFHAMEVQKKVVVDFGLIVSTI